MTIDYVTSRHPLHSTLLWATHREGTQEWQMLMTDKFTKLRTTIIHQPDAGLNALDVKLQHYNEETVKLLAQLNGEKRN